MPRVSDIRERRGRSRIFLDGEYWAEIDASVADRYGIREDATLDDETLHEARLEGERTLAMDRALHYLGYRSRTSAEVARRLRRAGYAAGTVEGVVGRLEDLGYLDDGEFARQYVEGRARRYGPRRLMRDLRHGGVDPEVSRQAVEERFSGGGELEAAFAAARRRYNAAEGSDAQSRRVYGFLARRGFSAEVSAEVARRFRGGEAEEGP